MKNTAIFLRVQAALFVAGVGLTAILVLPPKAQGGPSSSFSENAAAPNGDILISGYGQLSNTAALLEPWADVAARLEIRGPGPLSP